MAGEIFEGEKYNETMMIELKREDTSRQVKALCTASYSKVCEGPG